MNSTDYTDKMVSIIIPCYNREHYISDAIDSCLRQTYKNIEIIVVDDGSSDGSVSFIKSKYGRKVHLLEQKNKGSASARNTGLLSANGEFVIFLDSDDWLSDDLVECHIQTITKWADVEICCADSVAVISDGSMSELKKSPWPEIPSNPTNLFMLNPPPFPACEMYRKSAVQRHGGFDEDMKAFTDSGLRLRIALNGGLVVRTEGGFAIYRPVENSITKNSLKIHFHAIKLVKKLLASEYADDSKIRSLIGQRLIGHRLRYWNSWLKHHFSPKPLPALKFTVHLARVMMVDKGYLWFVIKHKPWCMPADRSF